MTTEIISEANPQRSLSLGDLRDVSRIVIDVVLERDESETVTAWAAALPGAVAEAPSEEEAVARLVEVVKEQLEIYREDGMPVPWNQDYQSELAPDAELIRAYLDA